MNRSELLGSFEFFASGLPAADAGGEVLDVGVAEFFSLLGAGFVSGAGRAAAVSDHEGAFVGWELGGEGVFAGSEVDGSWDVAVGEGGGTVDVDHGDFAVSDGLFEVVDGDVRVFGGHDGGGSEEGEGECEQFFHVFDWYVVWLV